ncbi:MAG TPA: DnaD domain protein [Clostridiaceae bacterium]|nr:DnaD domain protein [Clostridiaceae bacterium]
MERDSFIFYKSFYEAIAEADAKIQNEVFNAICKKALYEEDTKLTGVSKMLYTLIKPQLEANTKRYEDGKKGGRPKKETTGLTKEKTSGFENKKPNKNENVNVNDNENVNNNNNIDDSCVDGLQEIIDFYNNNIGMITPYAVDIFTDYTKEMTKDLIIYAMKKSVEANVRTIQYIKGILNNWSKSGIKTLVEAEKEDMKFEQNKSQRNNRKDFSEVEDF